MEPDVYDLIPKVEVHCHALGATRRSTAIDMARRAGFEVVDDDTTATRRFTSLEDFRRVLGLLRRAINTADDWARIGYETLVDGAEHGLRHRELHFTPTRGIDSGQTLESIVAGLSSGISDAEAETGVSCWLVASCDRTLPPARGVELVEEIGGLRRAGKAERVKGIGIDGPDPGISLEAWEGAFSLARSLGLRTTAHSQDGGPRNVKRVLDGLGVERIDHGMDILDDPSLTERVAALQIPINVCPNSNVRISNHYPSLEEHPFRRMREAGLLATLNTDDPGMMGIDLGEEYRSVARAQGIDFDEMCAISLDGIEASWLDESEKRALRVSFRQELEALKPKP